MLVGRDGILADTMAIDAYKTLDAGDIDLSTLGSQPLGEMMVEVIDEAGIDVRILGEAEEAHFAALGVISGFY